MREADASAVVGELVAAWNEHDMHRFAACFAEDAEFVNVGGMWWRGRDEIEERHAAAHAGRLGETGLTARPAAYREVGAGIALVHVTWELVGPAESRNGVWSLLLRDGADGPEVVSGHNTNSV